MESALARWNDRYVTEDQLEQTADSQYEIPMGRYRPTAMGRAARSRPKADAREVQAFTMLLTILAIALASNGGTAFPTCLY